MSKGEIHVGDAVNMIHTIKDQDDVVVDVSSASTLKIVFNKPDGTALLKDATLVTDGTDGKIKYKTSSATPDLNMAGNWERQGKVVIGTDTWKSDIIKFKVHANLPET